MVLNAELKSMKGSLVKLAGGSRSRGGMPQSLCRQTGIKLWVDNWEQRFDEFFHTFPHYGGEYNWTLVIKFCSGCFPKDWDCSDSV